MVHHRPLQLLVVDVHLQELGAGVLPAQLVVDRRDRAARAAPLCGEVDDGERRRRGRGRRRRRRSRQGLDLAVKLGVAADLADEGRLGGCCCCCSGRGGGDGVGGGEEGCWRGCASSSASRASASTPTVCVRCAPVANAAVPLPPLLLPLLAPTRIWDPILLIACQAGAGARALRSAAERSIVCF